MRRSYFRLFIVKFMIVVLLFGFIGCRSYVERKAIDIAGPSLTNLVDKLMGFNSVKIAEEGLPGIALLISAIIEFSPNNPETLSLAALAYTAYGLLLEWEDRDYAIHVYEIGRAYGLRALRCSNKTIKKGLDDGKHLIDLAVHLKKKDVPAAFWFGLSAGLRIMLEMDDPDILIQLGDVTALFDMIIVLDDSYFHYAPHLFQGAYAIIAGPLLGGGLEKSKNEFDIAFKATENKMMLAHVFYARYYATGIVDEELFDKTLNYVIDTPNDIFPEGKLINAIAKVKAKWLIDHKSDFFM